MDLGAPNMDITQDENGRIYVANNFGLLIFNGESWKLINTADGTKLRSVLAMGDRIYAGYQKDFGYYQPNVKGELVFVSLANKLPGNFRNFDEIWKIYAIDEAIYFCGFDYIFKFEQEKIETIVPESNLEITYPFQKELYVQVTDLGLTQLKGTQFVLMENGSFFKSRRISKSCST